MQYIITASGNMQDIMTALSTIRVIFGKDATLEEIATATKYGRLHTIVRQQLEDIERGQK